MKLLYSLVVIVVLAMASAAHASSLTYHGNNPDISPSANPLNGPNIQFDANLTRPHNPASSSGFTQPTEADLLKQSVISGLSSTYQQILTGNASGSGTVNFGDGSYAQYSTLNNIRTITFFDLDGKQTQISFPIN